MEVVIDMPPLGVSEILMSGFATPWKATVSMVRLARSKRTTGTESGNSGIGRPLAEDVMRMDGCARYTSLPEGSKPGMPLGPPISEVTPCGGADITRVICPVGWYIPHPREGGGEEVGGVVGGVGDDADVGERRVEEQDPSLQDVVHQHPAAGEADDRRHT